MPPARVSVLLHLTSPCYGAVPSVAMHVLLLVGAVPNHMVRIHTLSLVPLLQCHCVCVYIVTIFGATAVLPLCLYRQVYGLSF